MENRKTLLFLFLVLIIASFFRLYQITDTPPGLYPDEAMDGTNAQQVIQDGHFKVFYPENNGREGLFMNIQVVFLKVLGTSHLLGTSVNEPWVLRLPSAIFGILTVLGVYLLAKELFSVRAGLMSALFLATNFWHINFSRISFRAIMAPFFLVWAVYFFVLALRKIRERNIPGIPLPPVPKTLCGLSPAAFFASLAGGIAYGLGFYSYIAYRVSPLLFLLFIPFFRKDKGFWKAACVFLLATFFTALPIGLYFLQHPADFMGRTTQVSVFSASSPLTDLAVNTVKTLAMFNFYGDWNWRHNYAGSPELFFPVGLLFLFGIYLAVRGLRKDNEGGKYRFPSMLLFLWFLLAMLPVIISDEGIPHALRSILMLPPVIIFAGIGGSAAYDWLRTKLSDLWFRGAVSFSVALLVSAAYQMYFISWAHNSNVPGAFAADYVETGRQINALSANVQKYVVVEAGGVTVNGIPMPAQTVMFITDTFTEEGQRAKNIHYVLPKDETKIPAGADVFYVR